MKDYNINQLIENMIIKEKVNNSDNSISFKAHRIAENINDPDLIPILINIINNENNKNKRDAEYFILGKITKNTLNQESLKYLISRLEYETDKYVLMTLLDRISEIYKSNIISMDKIIQLCNDKRWQVRQSAIRALNKECDKNVENKLIEIINSDSDSYDKCYANSCLNKIGTINAIPSLELLLKSKIRDIKLSANLAIEEIKIRNQ
jgi:HEAT repeat protein